MTVIVDSHSHIFPPLHTSCGFETEAEHTAFLQLYISKHGEPARRLRDHVHVPEAEDALHDGQLAGPEGLNPAANFRVGRYGRFEWDYEGDTYYRSFLPPSLQEMVSPVGFILQQMARAGVDCSVLQNARLYGRLNQEFSDAMRDYPGKFIGLADVKETEAHTQTETDRLRDAIERLGLRGVYYANRGLFAEHYQHSFEDPKYDPYWETVRELGIPVFWEIQGVPLPTQEAYLEAIERLNRWSDRFPDIPSVLTHGIAPGYLEGNIPEPIADLLGREQVSIEVLYPIHWGRDHEYPYSELQPVIKRLMDLAGASRLIWGSDMPNVERNCTYKQSLDYLHHTLAGVASEDEMAMILGENVLQLLTGNEHTGRRASSGQAEIRNASAKNHD
jgi:predicted TIM-barrel fold metal-dependent hydrolase